jgi:hypothetical protein
MSRQKNRESGFALVLALLALLLLTSLGLSLSTTTGTELQISTNHRWAESARYNAEAGIEFGKQVLSNLDEAAWNTLLPPYRATAATFTPPVDASSRSYENRGCDARGNNMGYGVVLNAQGTAYQYMSATTMGGTTYTLNGAYTLWVRRARVWSGADLVDYGPGADVLILTSEGVAPYTGAVNNEGFASANRAVYTMEVVLSQSPPVGTCDSEGGQAGADPQNTNSYGCLNPTLRLGGTNMNLK